MKKTIKKIAVLLGLGLAWNIGFAQTSSLMAAEHAQHKGKILMIAANPSVSKTTGWPIGLWAAELTHPYWEFTHAGYQIDIVSPNGGDLAFDSYSDPEDSSAYSAHDLLSLGWKHSAQHMALLKNTRKLSDVKAADYAAIFLVGGQSPMYTFRGNQALANFVSQFYLSGKPTALVCHATSVLLDAKLPNGQPLVTGKKWTGFANSEEAFADQFVGKKIQPFWIEDEARKIPNSHFVVQAAFTPFAVADGNLITGQQQNSGAAAARLVLDALD